MTSISRNLNNMGWSMWEWFTDRRTGILYVGIACIVFGPLYNAGFVTDFLGWLACRETTPFWELYTCFGNRGLYYVPFVILETLTGGFGLHPLPWWIVWTGLHALNAYLVYAVSKALFSAFIKDATPAMPLLAGLIFLLHPWQVEVLAWKACANYLTSCLLMLLTLKFYLQYLTNGVLRKYWISVGCFALGLFTLEFVLIFPLVLCMVHWCLQAELPWKRRLAGVIKRMIPFAIAIAGWFLANKLLFGLWIGHYGADTHTAFVPVAMGSVVLKYLVKTFAFTRFLSFPTQTDIYNILDLPLAGAAMFGLLLGLGLLLLLRVQRMTSATRLQVFTFLAGVILIIPVTNLYFYYLQYSENDRYTYPAIAFFSIWIVLILCGWKGWIGKGILLGWIIVCLVGTTVLVRTWEQATRAYWHHIETFPVPEKHNVFLLNVPDNYRGAFMFRNIGGDSAFEEVYRDIAGADFSGKMYDVFQYNMTSLQNDVIVSRLGADTIKVEFGQWGNWWWRNGIGAERYSNSEYTAWPEGKWYYVVFNNPVEEADILYWTPKGWTRMHTRSRDE